MLELEQTEVKENGIRFAVRVEGMGYMHDDGEFYEVPKYYPYRKMVSILFHCMAQGYKEITTVPVALSA